MKKSIYGLILFSVFCLSSCNGPVEAPPPDNSIPESDLEAASNSEAVAILDPATHQFSLTWLDRFSDENAFGIERQDSETWQRVNTLPAISGTNSSASWDTTLSESGDYRVVAEKNNYLVPLQSTSGGSEFQVVIPDTVPVLVVDSEQPLTGIVTISLAEASSVTSVAYFVDLETITTVTTGDTFSFEWNTASVPSGNHLLSALACTSPGVYLELKLQIEVDHPDLTIHMALSNTFGIVDLDVSASADIGIESVESFLDDDSLGLLTSPNNGTLFRWTIDTTEFAPGAHTLRSVALDREGNTVESVLTPEFDQPPVLTVDTPVSGAIISGTLVVSGSFSDDTEGSTVSGWFGDVPILSATESPFSAEYSLSGVTPGNYSLSVRVTDANNVSRGINYDVVVETSESLAGILVEPDADLLDADDGHVLFSKADGSIHIKSADGSEYLLPDTDPIDHANDWQLCNGNVLVYGQLNGYPNPYQVFLYEPDMQRRNLSEEVQSIGHYDIHPVSTWPWVAWSSQWANSNGGQGGTHSLDVYFLMNLQTNEIIEVVKPADVTLLGNHKYDLSLDGQEVRFFYWAGTSPNYDIYSYHTLTQTSTRVTTSGDEIYVQSDNQRVAWELGDSTFMIGPVANPETALPITTTGQDFHLADGVIVWRESNGAAASIKVDDGSVETLSLYQDSHMSGTENGYVAYTELGELQVWDRQNGTRRVMSALPAKVKFGGNKLYVQTPGGAIYSYDLR